MVTDETPPPPPLASGLSDRDGRLLEQLESTHLRLRADGRTARAARVEGTMADLVTGAFTPR